MKEKEDMRDKDPAESPRDLVHPYADLTSKIIAAAMNVHTALGPGFQEKIYENALMREFADLGLSAAQQAEFPVLYKGVSVGVHILDLVVEEKVYVELKCKILTGLETAQVLSGLKAALLPVGLLINFNSEHLRDGIQRVILPQRYLRG